MGDKSVYLLRYTCLMSPLYPKHIKVSFYQSSCLYQGRGWMGGGSGVTAPGERVQEAAKMGGIQITWF